MPPVCCWRWRCFYICWEQSGPLVTALPQHCWCCFECGDPRLKRPTYKIVLEQRLDTIMYYMHTHKNGERCTILCENRKSDKSTHVTMYKKQWKVHLWEWKKIFIIYIMALAILQPSTSSRMNMSVQRYNIYIRVLFNKTLHTLEYVIITSVV